MLRTSVIKLVEGLSLYASNRLAIHVDQCLYCYHLISLNFVSCETSYLFASDCWCLITVEVSCSASGTISIDVLSGSGCSLRYLMDVVLDRGPTTGITDKIL